MIMFMGTRDMGIRPFAPFGNTSVSSNKFEQDTLIENTPFYEQ